MDKAVNMRDWGLFTMGNYGFICGVADNHPKLGKNVFVAHTSDIEEFKIEEDVAHVKTINRNYDCPIKFLNVDRCDLGHSYEVKGDMQTIFDYAKYCVNKKKGIEADENETFVHFNELIEDGKKEQKKIEEKRNNQLIKKAKEYENCLYIEVNTVSLGSLGAYHFGEKVGVIKPSLHVGMFQDSVLYMSRLDDDLYFDFRYFPYCDGYDMQSYCWSNNIEKIVIKNLKSRTLNIMGVDVKKNETKVFERSEMIKEPSNDKIEKALSVMSGDDVVVD